MNSIPLKILNSIAFVIMVTVNFLANVLPLGIGSTGDVSEKYPNLFTPAPVTFIVWGLIYLLLLVFVLYQWGLLDGRKNSDAIVKRIGIWFVVSCCLNTGWIFAWHFDVIWLSLLCMLGLLFSLIMITNRLNSEKVSSSGKLGSCIGFEIYFGWIIAATIANVSVFLTWLNWDRFGLSEVFWMVVVLCVGAGIASVLAFVKHRRAAALAVVWAYIGILIRHISPDHYDGKYSRVIAVAAICIFLIIVFIFVDIIRDPFGKKCRTK